MSLLRGRFPITKQSPSPPPPPPPHLRHCTDIPTRKSSSLTRVHSWNAAALTAPAEAGNPLEVDDESLGRDLDLMIKSPYAAAREAVRVWRAQEAAAAGGRKGTFIMTGNLLPRQILPVPGLVTLGIGKSGANSWLGLSDVTFKKEGIR